MKRILSLIFFIVICIITLSCSTNYYSVLLSEDARIYSTTDTVNIVTTIPKNTKIFLSSKPHKGSYRKIKWNNYTGWAYNPVYTSYSNYVPLKNTSETSSYQDNSISTYSSGGSVSVKGYHRKDGTYVRPHTRSAPSRRR